MNTWIRRSLQVGLLSAGVVLAAGAVASAADLTSVGNNGTGNGNQVYTPVQLPVNVCGIATSGSGAAFAECDGGSEATLKRGISRRASLVSVGNNGTGNGNQVYAPIQAPINVCGIATSVSGAAFAECDGGATAVIEDDGDGWDGPDMPAPVSAPPARSYHRSGGSSASLSGDTELTSVGNNGTLNGNQIYAPVQAPINVSQVATTVSGAAFAGDSDSDWSPAVTTFRAPSRRSAELTSIGNNGTLNGNQIYVPIQLPINVCGIATSVTGAAFAECDGGSTATLKRASANRKAKLVSVGNNGTANGNQVYAPVQVPVNVCGIATSVSGAAFAECDGGATAKIGGHHHSTTATAGRNTSRRSGGAVAKISDDAELTSVGNNGTLNGNQIYAPVQVPVNVSQIATTVSGAAFAS